MVEHVILQRMKHSAHVRKIKIYNGVQGKTLYTSEFLQFVASHNKDDDVTDYRTAATEVWFKTYISDGYQKALANADNNYVIPDAGITHGVQE